MTVHLFVRWFVESSSTRIVCVCRLGRSVGRATPGSTAVTHASADRGGWHPASLHRGQNSAVLGRRHVYGFSQGDRGLSTTTLIQGWRWSQWYLMLLNS